MKNAKYFFCFEREDTAQRRGMYVRKIYKAVISKAKDFSLKNKVSEESSVDWC